MLSFTAPRTIDKHDPQAELAARHPDWAVAAAAPDATSGTIAHVCTYRKMFLADPELLARDPDIIHAYILALLDSGKLQAGAAITQRDQEDAADLAVLRLGRWPAR